MELLLYAMNLAFLRQRYEDRYKNSTCHAWGKENIMMEALFVDLALQQDRV